MRYFETGKINSVYVPRVWIRMRIGGKTNESLTTILEQNREVLRGLKKNGISYSTFNFWTRKIANRASQFINGKMNRNA
jgi:hypothetical protein